MRCRDGSRFTDDSANRLQCGARKQIARHEKQEHAYDEQNPERSPHLGQVVVPITVVCCGRYDVVVSIECIQHADSLVVSDVKLDAAILQDSGDHGGVLLDDVILDSVVVEHPETGRIDGHFDFVDKVAVVEMNLLHDPGIHLVLQKQVGLGDGLAFEGMEEGFAARMFADQVDRRQAYEEYGGGGSRVFEGQRGSYLHGLSVRMKPMPGRVWISLTSKSRSTFLRR